LLALFTHIHLFWIAALLLALVDLPDFGTPLRSIAGSVEGAFSEVLKLSNAIYFSIVTMTDGRDFD
jgi:hypothetical protein